MQTSNISLTIALAVPLVGSAESPRPGPDWFALPIPHALAVDLPADPLPGEAEGALPLSDQGVHGGSNTFVQYSSQTVRRDEANQEWMRKAQHFGLESQVAVGAGVVLGLQATDDQIRQQSASQGRSWERAHPESGVRFGFGADALRRWSDKPGDWVLGLNVWWPLLDSKGELEGQVGLRRARTWRSDFTLATRDVAALAYLNLLDSTKTSVNLPDSVALVGKQLRWTWRTGGDLGRLGRHQLWIGQRRIEAGKIPEFGGWQILSNSGFVGWQGSQQWKSFGFEGEARAELGRDTLANFVDSAGQTQSTLGANHVRHRLVSGLLQATYALGDGWLARFTTRGNLRILDQAGQWGQMALPGWEIPSGGEQQTAMIGTDMALRAHTRWVDIEPRIGYHASFEEGQANPLWTYLRRDTETQGGWLRWGGEVAWRQQQSVAALQVTGWTALHKTDWDPGLRTEIELRQGF